MLKCITNLVNLQELVLQKDSEVKGLQKLVKDLMFTEKMAGLAYEQVCNEKMHLHKFHMVSRLHCQL